MITFAAASRSNSVFFYRACSLLLVLLCSALCLSAQMELPRCRVEHYTTDNGLPQNSAYSLQFDKTGSLWIGTQGGVVNFNGYRFKTNFPQHPSQRIGHILKDNTDSIWIMDNNYDAFQVLPERAGLKKVAESFGAFWKKMGVYKSREQINRATYPDLVADKLNNFYYYDTATRQLLCLNNDLQYGYFEKKPFLFTVGDTLLILPAEGEMLAVKTGSGPMPVSGKQPVFVKRELQPFFKTAVFFRNPGKTYCLYNGTLFELGIHNNEVTLTGLLTGIPPIKDPINCVYNPAFDLYAISSNIEGFYLLQPSYFFNSSRPGLPDFRQTANSLTGVFVLRNGDLLDNKGVRYPYNGASPFPEFKNVSQYSLSQDPGGDIWYQAEEEGDIYRYNNNLKQQALFHYSFPRDERINCFSQGTDGNHYFATHAGVYRLRESGAIDLLYRQNETERHTGHWAEHLYQLNKNALLLLTKDGLFLLDLNTGSKTLVPGSSGMNFRAAFLSQNGNLWLGSYGNGLFLWKGGILVALPQDLHGDLKNANAILEEEGGFLWISSNNGLFRISEQDLLAAAAGGSKEIYYQYFDKTYGFASNEFNGGPNNPAARTSDGRFCFSNLQGVVGCIPSRMKPVTPSAPLFISVVMVDDTLLTANNGNGALILPYDFNRLQVEINTAYFGPQQNLQIQYRLRGSDTTWRELEPGKLLEFTRLLPGNYQLEIRKKAGFGLGNYVQVQLSFRVLPPFYKTPWFFALLLLVLLALILTWTHFRTKRLLKQEKVLKELVEEKTADLSESNLKLQERIHENELMMSVLSHDIRGPVKYLYESLDILGQMWDKLPDDKKKNIVVHATKGTQSIYGFTSNFLNWMRLKGGAVANLHDVNLHELSRQIIYFSQQDQTQLDGIELINEINPQQRIYTDPYLLLIILNNIVDNAVKYTRAGRIVLQACEGEEGQLDIICTDTGSGMPPGKVDSILYMQKENAMNTHQWRNDSFKLGYLFIREALPLLGGTLQIFSEPQKGTKVIIRIAQKEIHQPSKL